MTRFSVGAQELGQERDSSFDEFITLASGRSVVSGADWGPERVEMGLSGEAMVRVFWTSSGLHVNLLSTTKDGDTPPIVVRLGDEEARLPARVVEGRLRAIRVLYSMVLLLSEGRGEELGAMLRADPNADPEDLLQAEDWLQIEGIAPGSWYVTLWTGVRKNLAAVYSIALMVFGRGREAVLGKLEAERRLKDLEADEQEFRLLTAKIDYGLGLADKVEDPETKSLIRCRVEGSLAALLGPNPSREEVIHRTDLLLEQHNKDE